jgi:hypothetical protein
MKNHSDERESVDSSDAAVDDFTVIARLLYGSDTLPSFIEESPDFVIDAARHLLVREFGFGSDLKLVAGVQQTPPGVPLPDDVEALAQRLLVILYTGETSGPAPSVQLGHYPWALAWRVLAFTKAPGICGAGFAAWSRP